MEHQYRTGSSNDAASKDATRIRALTDELNRRVRILESDIAREEQLAGASDPFNAAYPVQARLMTAQRDNLRQTIAVLEKRLPEQTLLTGVSIAPAES